MVKLVYASPLRLILNGLNYSHGNQSKNKSIDELLTNEELDLIYKIGFHKNHSSILEHSLLVFDVEISQKALLELSRHRIGISMTITSTRYSLNKMEMNFMKTRDSAYNQIIRDILKKIQEFVEKAESKSDFDDISMLLPQAFYYTGQISFNLRSLVHLFELRLSQCAHYSIRRLANEMYDELPSDYKYLLDKYFKKE